MTISLPPGFKHAGALFEHAQFVGDVLDRVEQRHKVKGVVGKGQFVAGALHDGQPALLRHRERAKVVVDAKDFAVVGQVVRHVAGAAADIEHFAHLSWPDGPSSASRYFKIARVRPANQACLSSSRTVSTGVPMRFL